MWPEGRDSRSRNRRELIDALERVLDKGIRVPHAARTVRPHDAADGRMVISSMQVDDEDDPPGE